MGSAAVTDVMVDSQSMTFYIPDVDVQVQVPGARAAEALMTGP